MYTEHQACRRCRCYLQGRMISDYVLHVSGSNFGLLLRPRIAGTTSVVVAAIAISPVTIAVAIITSFWISSWISVAAWVRIAAVQAGLGVVGVELSVISRHLKNYSGKAGSSGWS
ncbi:hypothetical protein F4777DRAFT_140909 [Nemania sp. FL0916]|nr:hypothetical protein F4777DRAFT_140909 [Nemania sp. FL0916]